jgi:hypothetical protein
VRQEEAIDGAVEDSDFYMIVCLSAVTISFN